MSFASNSQYETSEVPMRPGARCATIAGLSPKSTETIMQTLEELDTRVLKLQRELEEAREEADAARANQRKHIISELNALIAKHDITASELSFAKSPKVRPTRSSKDAKRVPSVPKYRNSTTGQTWTGHGKRPHWIPADKEKREEYLIKQ
ncbi:H-NS histone family protein [Pandoraea communis]|uniref:H-NS histone family protein n=2 Tax=Pandoraea TaxID=93217 RepID=UPI0025A6313F|nr:H-NS histone family protein [Pandoraea communis]MDM8359637.1 H-NS histone family protein [Pandoraea communis]